MIITLLAAPSVGKSSPPVLLIPICLFIMAISGIQALSPNTLRSLNRYQYKDREMPPQLSPGFLLYSRVVGGVVFTGATMMLIIVISKL